MMKCKGKLTLKTFLAPMPRLEVQAGFPTFHRMKLQLQAHLLNASWTHTVILEGGP